MEDPSHNVWATPHDIALQQMEYTRRQEALARDAAHRLHRQQEQQQQQQQAATDDLVSQMGGLGYGQTDPDPARIQAGVEYRSMQRRLHEAEQALAAERTLRTTHLWQLQ